MGEYVLAFLAAFGVAYIATPLARKLALASGAVDYPDPETEQCRRVHKRPVPRLGGLAIFLGFLGPALYLLPREGLTLMGLLLGGGIMLALGIWDDLRTLSPRAKLAGQIAAGLVFVALGNRIMWVTNPWAASLEESMWYVGVWAIPLTLFWIVGITNTINLIDGLDGLAAGVSTIASVTLLLVAFQEGQSGNVVLTAALAGACLGFLPYNFNPARIFMGDTGSLFLGFALAAIAVQGALKSATVIALAVPIVVLGLPILDTALAIVRRYRSRAPIFAPDRQHLHHRLLDRGLSQRQTVFLLYSVSAVFGVAALALMQVTGAFVSVLLLAAAASLLLGLRRLRQLEAREKNLKGS